MASFKKAIRILKDQGEAKKDARAAKDPRYAKVLEIEREALRRSKLPDSPGGAKSTHQERYDLRAGMRAAVGFPPEKKKRGGVAGVYDRNKKVIMPALTIGAGLLTGGLAAPALVGALKGFDREGKGGIGFDVGQGLRGGLEGAAIGGATQLASGAVQGGLSALKGGAGVKGALSGAKTGALGTSTGQQLVKIGSGAKSALGAGGVDAAAGAPGAAGTIAGTMAKAPMNWADWLTVGTSALGGIDAYQRSQRAGKEANRQFDMASGQNEAAMGLLPQVTSRIGDRSGAPDLSYLDDADNPYTARFKRRAPMIGAPGGN